MPESSLLESLFDEAERRPLTVSELNAELRSLLERQFASVWVEGEIVNFTAAASGHWYFGLNDGTAQIKAVCWKGTNFKVRFRPENGHLVRVRGRISFYEARGETQLVVESLEPAGEGALRAAFEQIRARLQGEGLFDVSVKRPLPYFPRRVAVVTSPTGAAFHDIHNVLTRRARSVSILLVPTLVQGEGSAGKIRQAVLDVNEYNRSLTPSEKIDVMIVGRGGGSAEDLWAFNDEELARAIRQSDIPVISAVGHEIDTSISDMVADVRAATPSAAAEMVAAREQDIVDGFRSREDRLRGYIEYQLLDARTRYREAAAGLRHGFSGQVQKASSRLANVASKLSVSHVRAAWIAVVNRLAVHHQALITVNERGIKLRNERLNVSIAKLDALSPLSVLTRGYSITQSLDGRVIRSISQVNKGDHLRVKLEKGTLNTEVLSIEDDGK